jgi:hypothetical protein
VSLDECFEFLTKPVHPVILPVVAGADSTVAAVSPGAGVVARPAAELPRWLPAVAGAFAVLGVATLGVEHHTRSGALVVAGNSSLPDGTTFNLPARFGDWQRVDSAEPYHKAETQGINSQVWNYQNGQVVASIAIDYPFRGYHDVTTCYQLVGWNIDQVTREDGVGPEAGIPDIAVEMSREPVSHASLWFSTVDEAGHWLERPVMAKSFLERWELSGRVWPNSYRVQLLVTGYGPLVPAERAAARQLFAAARRELVQQLLEKLRGKS